MKKRALGFLIFGILVIAAVYVSVTRWSPFLEAEESGADVSGAVTSPADIVPPTLPLPPTLEPPPTVIPATPLPPTPIPPPTVIPATPVPPTPVPLPTLEPSATLVPPTATLVPSSTPLIENVSTAVTEQVESTLAGTLPTDPILPATEIPSEEAITATEEITPTVEMAVPTEELTTVAPTVGADVVPTVARQESDMSAMSSVNMEGQLSVGTPVVEPQAPVTLPTATPVLVQPTIVPVDVQPSLVGTVAPTVSASLVPALAQITGSVSAPVAASLVLTFPDGTTVNGMTAADGSFAFAGLQPGVYRLQASADGFLTSQIEFTLADGQTLTLPNAVLRAGDTNRDNVVDVRDAVLIAANFGQTAIAPETDLNRDGVIDIRDLTLLGAVFGQSGPSDWG